MFTYLQIQSFLKNELLYPLLLPKYICKIFFLVNFALFFNSGKFTANLKCNKTHNEQPRQMFVFQNTSGILKSMRLFKDN